MRTHGFSPFVPARATIFAVAFIVSGVTACFEAPDPFGPDAGGEPNGNDAGNDPNGNDAGELLPDAGTGDPARKFGLAGMFTLTEHPLANEDRLMGFVDVLEGRFEAVSGATVTVNGTSVPESQPGIYDTSRVAIHATPGEALRIQAREGAESATAEVPCPGPVQFTSHAEGQAVAAGETLTITWQGNVHVNASFVPELTLDGYNASANTVTRDSEYKSVKEGADSAQIVVPRTTAGGYLLQLKVWGESVYPNGRDLQCIYKARIHLTKK